MVRIQTVRIQMVHTQMVRTQMVRIQTVHTAMEMMHLRIVGTLGNAEGADNANAQIASSSSTKTCEGEVDLGEQKL